MSSEFSQPELPAGDQIKEMLYEGLTNPLLELEGLGGESRDRDKFENSVLMDAREKAVSIYEKYEAGKGSIDKETGSPWLADRLESLADLFVNINKGTAGELRDKASKLKSVIAVSSMIRDGVRPDEIKDPAMVETLDELVRDGPILGLFHNVSEDDRRDANLHFYNPVYLEGDRFKLIMDELGLVRDYKEDEKVYFKDHRSGLRFYIETHYYGDELFVLLEDALVPEKE